MPARASRRATGALVLLLASFPLLSGAWVRAGEVELAPLVGLQYGGAVATPTGRTVGIDVGLQYGATLDVEIAASWSAELLFARQETQFAGATPLGLVVERYMAGAREEKVLGRGRFHGTGLIGMTRVVAEGAAADERFSLALGLGLQWPLTRRLGVRADARGYYALVSSGGGTACVNGACLFVFGGSGVWQGDVTVGLAWTFGAPPRGPRTGR